MFSGKTFKIVTVVSLIFVIIGIIFLPFVFYLDVISGGLNSKYLLLLPSDPALLKAKRDNKYQGESPESSKWEKFHFNNFQIVLPVRHPEYSIVPYIRGKIKRKKIEIGVKFLSYKNNREYISLKVGPRRRFIIRDVDAILFKLPVVKKIFDKIKTEKLIEDLFSKNLNEVGFTDFFDMLYNLYILKLRQLNFPEDVLKVYFIKEKKIASLQVKDEDLEYKKEILYLYDGDYFYSMVLRIKKNSKIGEFYRIRLFRTLQIKKSTKESARSIYVDYRTLNLDQRIDQEGMIYLFMAYSHDISNKEFLRYMIQFLEKGKNNLQRLIELYKFAYDNYDTNFSNIKSILKENESEFEKRKMEEEFKKDAEVELKYSNDGELIDFEGSDEERIDHYLNNAKDVGSDLDDTNDYIIVD